MLIDGYMIYSIACLEGCLLVRDKPACATTTNFSGYPVPKANTFRSEVLVPSSILPATGRRLFIVVTEALAACF